jgi:hypothetical protein
MWKRIFLSVFLVSATALAAKPGAGDYARRQRLQRSALQWFERQGASHLSDFRSVTSYGVDVREKPVVLPPDLGGPLPGHPVTVVVEGWVSGSKERENYWVEPVHCRFSQSVLARAGANGKPEAVIPSQPFRAPIACASGYLPNPRDYGRY